MIVPALLIEQLGCKIVGVSDVKGGIYSARGLFVADGSVIPSSIGFHPVMTISAVSEHIADAVVHFVSG